MTIAEIEKLEKLLTEQGAEATLSFLADKKIGKQHAGGLVDVEINRHDGKTFSVKALPLSENFCVVKVSGWEVSDFKGFRGLVNLTHTRTGTKMRTIRCKKADAIRLARALEGLADWSFDKPEDVKKLPEGTANKTLDLIRDYE